MMTHKIVLSTATIENIPNGGG